MVATVGIGIMSAAIGAGLRIQTHLGTLGANLYLLVAAESGTGKDLCLDQLSKPLRQLETSMERKFTEVTLPYLKARQVILERQRKASGVKALKEADLERVEQELAQIVEKLSRPPQIITNDATVESLTTLMAGQPGQSLASITSEARRNFDLIGGRYSQSGCTDESFYCAAYSGSSIRVNRKGGPPIKLDQPCLSVLWLIQPDKLRTALNQPHMVDSGLLCRFLLHDSRAEPQIIPPGGLPPFPTCVSSQWETLVHEIAAYRNREKECKVVELTEEARTHFVAAANATSRLRSSDGPLNDIAPYVARWAENAYRLGLILHVAQYGAKAHRTPLSGSTARHAVTLAEWYAHATVDLLTEVRAAKHQDRDKRLLELVAMTGGEMPLRQLRKRHGYSESEIEQSIKRLPEMEIIERTTGGRPSRVLRYVIK